MGSSGTVNSDDQYFLWLSDVHFDPFYSTLTAFKAAYYPGANCQNDDAPPLGRYGCDSARPLVQSALEHAINLTTGGDAPYSTPAFVVLSGDSIRHGVDQLFAGGDFKEGAEARSNSTSNSSNTAVEDAAASTYHAQAMDAAGDILNELVSMVGAAFPESEIIVSLGNNDVVPDYYLELYDEGGDDLSLGSTTLTPQTAGMLGVLYNALSRGQTENATNAPDGLPGTNPVLLESGDETTFLHGGYYSRTVHNGALTILSLNTVLYSNYFVSPEQHHQRQEPLPGADDPGHQFAWMKTVLSGCRVRGSQAIIVGHIPPAVGSFRHTQLWKEQYIQTYYDIIKEFDAVIAGQLFGHLHSDEFRIGISDSGNEGSIDMIPSMATPLLLGPSITPLHGNDPSIRFVKYRFGQGTGQDNDGKFRLLDYDSHRFSIADERQWSKLYTFSQAYDVASDVISEEGLSASVFRTIFESMEDKMGSESSVLALYRTFMLSGANGDANNRGANTKCDVVCRDEFICTFQSATRRGYDTCLLDRRPSWAEGRIIFGVVALCVFAAMVLMFGIARYRRVKRKREEYESTPSVAGLVLQEDETADANDQEMT